MITLIHGDDISKSRDELVRLKQQYVGKEIRQLEGKSVSDQDLIQALSSSSLFGGNTVVIIENLFSGLGKKIKRIQELATVIKDNSTDIDVILWEQKEIGKTAQSGLGSTVVQKLFKLPTIIFQFLDNVQPGNSKVLLSLYQQLVAIEPPDLIHAMVLKRIRQLLFLKSGHVLEGQQQWQLTRLTNQARPFTLERLVTLYRKLKIMEYNRNSGQAVFDLKETTEMLLCTI